MSTTVPGNRFIPAPIGQIIPNGFQTVAARHVSREPVTGTSPADMDSTVVPARFRSGAARELPVDRDVASGPIPKPVIRYASASI